MAHASMLHEEDPRDTLLNSLGDLSEIEIFHNHLIVAVYQRPEKTKSGLILASSTRDEDKYQSKIGLIVKMGPAAFVSNAEWVFPDIKLGDWVVFRPSDGWNTGVNGILCRVLLDTSIKGRVSHPDCIW